MPLSSSTIKTPPSPACFIRRFLRGKISPQPKMPTLKSPATCKKWVPLSKKASISSLKDPAP